MVLARPSHNTTFTIQVDRRSPNYLRPTRQAILRGTKPCPWQMDAFSSWGAIRHLKSLLFLLAPSGSLTLPSYLGQDCRCLPHLYLPQEGRLLLRFLIPIGYSSTAVQMPYCRPLWMTAGSSMCRSRLQRGPTSALSRNSDPVATILQSALGQWLFSASVRSSVCVVDVLKANACHIDLGYAQNGPASASLAVFDAASGTFQSSYTPPTAITAPTATTLPVPTQTGTGTGSGGTGQPGSAEYPRPTGSQSPGSGNPSGSGNGNGDGNDGNGDGDPSVSGNTSKSHATTIALSTVFGVLGLLVATTAASWYIRRRNSRDSFHRLGASDGEDSPHGDEPIPVAGAVGSHENGFALPPVVLTVRDRLSRVVPGITPSRLQQERRDMLADEDTRDFETSNGWYYIQRNPSSGQSSWTSKRRPTLEKVYDSLVSLKSMGGAVLDYAAGAAVAGARSIKSREGSSTSRASLTWKEKQPSFDPYSDDFGLLNYASPPLLASRPRGGRQGSSYTYVDPFDDYDVESLKFSPEAAYHDDGDEERGFLSLSDPPPRTKLQTMMPPATLDLTQLTPVSERTSVPTISDPASSSETSLSNHTLPHSPFVTSSNSSHDPLHSPRRPSSVIDANTPPSQPMQRSNSWWTRFAKTPILDRRSSSVSRSNRPLDFRDPNPPPRLIPIEESIHSQSPDSPESKHRSGSGGHQRYLTHHHGRSASSLGTAKTADSDVLERMGRTMQIIQKEGSTSSSQRSGPSRDVSGDATAGDEFGTVGARPLSIIESDSSSGRDATALVMSPTEMTGAEAGRSFAALSSPPPVRPSLPERTSSGSIVAARIQAYERRMSQVLSPPTSPTRAKSPPPVPPRAYGLAPKQPLFVANPDHRHASSGDS